LARLSKRSFFATLSFCLTCFVLVKWFDTPHYISKIYQIQIEHYSVSYPDTNTVFYMGVILALISVIYGLLLSLGSVLSNNKEYNSINFFNAFVFAVGLGFSGMTKPQKVLGFFDIGPYWDPSLMVCLTPIYF
jgi:hypothetical protein